jgi:hypothetical protein
MKYTKDTKGKRDGSRIGVCLQKTSFVPFVLFVDHESSWAWGTQPPAAQGDDVYTRHREHVVSLMRLDRRSDQRICQTRSGSAQRTSAAGSQREGRSMLLAGVGSYEPD